MSDLAKIRAKLAALRAKTTANGCTEAEAIAAAEKAAELMASHDLSEADLERPVYDELMVELGGRRTRLDSIWPMVAKFANCKGWLRRDGSRWRYVYFGRDADVLVAEYVHEVIRRAADGAVVTFKASTTYQKRRKPKTRAQALKAFLEGFAMSIRAKLFAGLWKRADRETPGKALAVIENIEAQLDSELDRRGKNFATMRSIATAKGKFRNAARARGFGAGRSLVVEAAVSGSAAPVAGLLT
ncbi:DUF2786 domain-containing protein [Kaistia dalseonensis]|uniref:DUF2786 domain-containing protein n=1 Tax=Kaistia dalseonensis TaxID=410840 RepID=A0ABU0HC96_9HYPH|nr:DUF2786 domain-containing protein [Kaistia dalseonensis]MCX5497301.1 DUF2786 domain-containing protein [Kaistia dalseonensis]MDQ0439938.1 hypothetical protein [Kaistia dalseonensis]